MRWKRSLFEAVGCKLPAWHCKPRPESIATCAADRRLNDRMDNKPLLWVLGGGAFAFTAVVAYWIFAITLAHQLKSDQVSPQKTAEFIHAILEANRNNYTDNVVVKLSHDGIEAHEHWRE